MLNHFIRHSQRHWTEYKGFFKVEVRKSQSFSPSMETVYSSELQLWDGSYTLEPISMNYDICVPIFNPKSIETDLYLPEGTYDISYYLSFKGLQNFCKTIPFYDYNNEYFFKNDEYPNLQENSFRLGIFLYPDMDRYNTFYYNNELFPESFSTTPIVQLDLPDDALFECRIEELEIYHGMGDYVPVTLYPFPVIHEWNSETLIHLGVEHIWNITVE